MRRPTIENSHAELLKHAENFLPTGSVLTVRRRTKISNQSINFSIGRLTQVWKYRTET